MKQFLIFLVIALVCFSCESELSTSPQKVGVVGTQWRCSNDPYLKQFAEYAEFDFYSETNVYVSEFDKDSSLYYTPEDFEYVLIGDSLSVEDGIILGRIKGDTMLIVCDNHLYTFTKINQ